MDNLGDQNTMVFNAVHKLGRLYDAIYFFNEHRKIDRKQIETFNGMANFFYKYGAYLGLIFNIVFYTEGQPKPEDPLEGVDHNAIDF